MATAGLNNGEIDRIQRDSDSASAKQPSGNVKANDATWRYGNPDATVVHGKIHKDASVICDWGVFGSDGRHAFWLDKDGMRKGWTSSTCPGNFKVECGSDNPVGSDSLMLEAKNGNIIIKASNGKIRMEADDIELVAKGTNDQGNVKVIATETISLDSKKLITSSKSLTKIVSTGVTEICANSCLKLYGSVIGGVTDAVAVKDSKVGGKRYQQQCTQL